MKGVARPDDPIFEFDGFLVDPVLQRVTARGVDVAITRKTLQLLVVLLEHHGELVTKDELLGAIWPDTFVEENNLARTVSMLRKALHEHGSDPSAIQTEVGRGYRFIAPVVTSTRGGSQHDAAQVAAPAGATRPAGSPRAVARFRAGLVAAAVIVVAGSGAMYQVMPALDRADVAAIEPRLWRLTSGGRLETEPTWSPDGRSIAYSSDRAGNFDIWVQGIDQAEAFQLTTDPGRDWQPSWSPDGGLIAYRSERDGGGLYIQSISGALIRRVTDGGYHPRWSPDGRTLLFSTTRYPLGSGLQLVDVETGRTVDALPGDLATVVNVSANWHPDGRLSVYGRHPVEGWGLWTGSPVERNQMLRSDVSADVQRRLDRIRLQITAFSWAPDGRTLYVAGRTDDVQNLWQVEIDSDTLAWTAGPTRMTTSAARETDPAVSPDGRRVLFSSRVDRTQVWALPFDAATGRVGEGGEAVTPPGADAFVLDFSGDGRLAYSMERGSRHELWVRTTDRRDSLIRAEAQAAILQPRWSPDGRQLVYYSDAGPRDSRVVLLDARNGAARPLETASEPRNVFAWAPDGSSLIVGCPALDHPHAAICEVPLDPDGRAVASRVLAADSRRNLWQARSSPTGEWVSFIAAAPPLATSTIYAMPASGGTWIPITNGRQYDDKPRWAPDGRSVYYLSLRDGFWNLWRQAFDSDRGQPVGPPVQVTHFTSSDRMIVHRSQLQTAITDNEFVVPLTEASGAIWMLDLRP